MIITAETIEAPHAKKLMVFDHEDRLIGILASFDTETLKYRKLVRDKNGCWAEDSVEEGIAARYELQEW